MTLPDTEQLQQRFGGLGDRELLEIVTVHAEDYRDEALEIARQELERRGMNVPTVSEFLEALSADELKDSALFCISCYNATTSEAFSATGEFGMRRLMGDALDPCSTCGSVVREHFFAPFGIPLARLGQYRVKQKTVPWPGAPIVVATRRLRQPL